MKKIISLVLAMIMVFAIAATAFAATVGSVPSHEHRWGSWIRQGGFLKRTCEECGITEIKDGEDDEEENPNTGAAGIMGMIALVSAAGAVSFKRK
jgi:hypothetical protein